MSRLFDDLARKPLADWCNKWGMCAGGAEPLVDFDKFSRSPVEVRERFLRLMKLNLRNLKMQSNLDLHEDLAPLTGSLWVYQDGLAKQLEMWINVYEGDHLGRGGEVHRIRLEIERKKCLDLTR